AAAAASSSHVTACQGETSSLCPCCRTAAGSDSMPLGGRQNQLASRPSLLRLLAAPGRLLGRLSVARTHGGRRRAGTAVAVLILLAAATGARVVAADVGRVLAHFRSLAFLALHDLIACILRLGLVGHFSLLLLDKG